MLQAAIEELRRTSAADIGTYTANANVIRNLYAKRNILQNYNEVKDFFGLHLNAYIVAATLEYFNVKSMKDDFVPEAIKAGAPVVQTSWLMSQVIAMVKHYILFDVSNVTCGNTEAAESVTTEPQTRRTAKVAQYVCPACNKAYKYKACMEKHIKKLHPRYKTVELAASENATSKSSTKDGDEKVDTQYNYACVTLMHGLLLRNMDDAVHEGDGDRILRLYKFLLLQYKMGKHKNYSLAVFKLLCSVHALLSQRSAYQLVWNRTINERKGKGHRKSLDLRMENYQLVAKTVLRHSGMQNLTPELAVKTGRFIGPLDKLMANYNHDLGLVSQTSHKQKEKHEKDLEILVEEVHVKSQLFKLCKEGRHFEGDLKYDQNAFGKLDVASLLKWMNECKKRFHENLQTNCICAQVTA